MRPKKTTKSAKMLQYGATLHVSQYRLAGYRKKLKALVKKMREDVEKKVLDLLRGNTYKEYKEYNKKLTTMDASIGSESKIMLNKLKQKFVSFFSKRAKKLAEEMVNGVLKDNRVILNNSLREMADPKDRAIELRSPLLPKYTSKNVKEQVKILINENIALIKDIPEKYMNQVSGDLYRNLTGEVDLQKMKNDLMKRGGMTERRAKNIAEDQTRKASNVINAERMKAVGIKYFEWSHSGGGQNPRKLHMEMDGKIYSFDDLPIIDENTGERGIPGQLPNCRCTMIPVHDFQMEERK